MPICLSTQSKFAANSPVFFIFNVKVQENLKIYFCWEIHLFLGLLARDIASHSYAQNTPLIRALNPLRRPCQLMPQILPKQRWWVVWGLRFWRR